MQGGGGGRRSPLTMDGVETHHGANLVFGSLKHNLRLHALCKPELLRVARRKGKGSAKADWNRARG